MSSSATTTSASTSAGQSSSISTSTPGYDYLFKLLLIGDAGVGKSSILLRFTDDTFDDNMHSTIGVDFRVKMITSANGKTIKVTIWDTAGQERFRTLTSSYYRGAQGIIFVYEVGRRETFENLNQWLEEVDTYCSPGEGRHVIKLLVGNKVDKDVRQVSKAEGEAWAKQRGMIFIEASAKTKTGIQQVFQEVIQKILDSPHLLQHTMPARKAGSTATGRPTTLREPEAEGGGCCILS